MTTSGVGSLARTRLPAVTISAPVRPGIGARMVAYCSWTLAFSTAARSAPSVASSAAAVVRAVSTCSRARCRARQILVALGDRLGVGGLRRVALEVGLRLLQRRFERPPVEGEQDLALCDVVALLEFHRGQLAGDLRAHRTFEEASTVPMTAISSGTSLADRGDRCDRYGRRGTSRLRLLASPREQATAAVRTPITSPLARPCANRINTLWKIDVGEPLEHRRSDGFVTG